MDEKETYLKDNEASRAELNEAIDDYAVAFSDYEQDMLTTINSGGTPVFQFDEQRAKVQALLDVLYARLYLAECPF